jgi:YggT family protein
MTALPWWAWLFLAPNYLLALLSWTLIGRFLLSLAVRPDAGNGIWRVFRRLTDPALAAARWLVPGCVPALVRPLAAAGHVFLLRGALFAGFYAMGWIPHLAAG